jgi:hypothetical protein
MSADLTVENALDFCSQCGGWRIHPSHRCRNPVHPTPYQVRRLMIRTNGEALGLDEFVQALVRDRKQARETS